VNRESSIKAPFGFSQDCQQCKMYTERLTKRQHCAAQKL
jgi:hypothetical protein